MFKLRHMVIMAGAGILAVVVNNNMRSMKPKKDVVLPVPWEKNDEAREVMSRVAEVTGDELKDISVSYVIKFEDCCVYVVDSDFKGYACRVYKDGAMEISERIRDWLF